MGGMGQPMPFYVIEPLTTVFTPPYNCLLPTYTVAGAGGNDTFIPGSPYFDTVVHGYTSSCLPYSALEIIYDTPTVAALAGLGYSPGLCPSGWSTASAAYSPPRTTALCCPTSYTISANTDDDAYSFNCTKIASEAVVISDDVTSSYTSVYAVMRGIAVTQADDDRELLASATAPSSSGAATTAEPGSSVSGVPSSTATAAQETNTSPSGLSTGAKAGIGVGAAVGALLIISALAGFFILKRRRRQQPADVGGSDGFQKAELDADGNPSQTAATNEFQRAELIGEGKPVPELKARQLYEADGGAGRPGEMDSSVVRAELEGDRRGWEAPPRRVN